MKSFAKYMPLISLAVLKATRYNASKPD